MTVALSAPMQVVTAKWREHPPYRNRGRGAHKTGRGHAHDADMWNGQPRDQGAREAGNGHQRLPGEIGACRDVTHT
jgi:hypothetical protein